VHRDRDGERPAGGDDDPAGIVALGALQDDVGHDAIAEDDEDGGAEELCKEWGHDDGGGERRYYRSPTASASCAESGVPCTTFPVARTGYCWKSLGTCAHHSIVTHRVAPPHAPPRAPASRHRVHAHAPRAARVERRALRPRLV